MIHICTTPIASWLAYFNLITGLFGGIYCGVYYMCLILSPPLTVGPQMLRGVTLWGMLQHNKYMLQHGECVCFGRTRIMRLTSSLEERGKEVKDEETALRLILDNHVIPVDQLSSRQKAIRVRNKMK